MRSNNCISGPKYCPKCSAELDTRAKVCKFCNFNLENKPNKTQLSKKIKSFFKNLK